MKNRLNNNEMRYFILIPVFNESASIELLYNSLSKLKLAGERFYVFVDDGSTDDSTRRIQQAFRDEKFKLLTKNKNVGPGDSFNQGFEWILQESQHPSDVVITLEGDNTSDLDILADMLSISALGYDLVLASVYVQGGGFDQTNLLRKGLSFIANISFRFLFDLKVQTLSSFYRVYHVELLRRIKLQNDILITESGFLCMLEILLKAIKANAKIIEVPMVLQTSKRKGRSKMKILKTIANYIRLSVQSRKWKL